LTDNCVNDIGMLEARELLLKNGSISLIVDEKHKYRVKSCSQRIDKLEKLLRNKSKINKIRYYFYSVYYSFLNTILTMNHPALDHLVNIYMIINESVSNIHGESINNGKFKVTFTKRT
jgi:hypothetical protein